MLLSDPFKCYYPVLMEVIERSPFMEIRITLKLYDWWVLGVSNRLAWGCPIKKHLLPHLLEHSGSSHLDIGVGTGFYLTHVPGSNLISSMDLNGVSLNATSTGARESKIKRKVSHDVFEPYPAALHGQPDPIPMFYLLHCLSGDIFTKSCVIHNAAQALTDDGTLYRATILGDGVVHNSFGQKLMRIHNQRDIFSNTRGSEEDLIHIPSEHFENIKTKVQGTIVMFSASGRRQHPIVACSRLRRTAA